VPDPEHFVAFGILGSDKLTLAQRDHDTISLKKETTIQLVFYVACQKRCSQYLNDESNIWHAAVAGTREELSKAIPSYVMADMLRPHKSPYMMISDRKNDKHRMH
jgi:hypothetical protein